jgi:hypothetical protein
MAENIEPSSGSGLELGGRRMSSYLNPEILLLSPEKITADRVAFAIWGETKDEIWAASQGAFSGKKPLYNEFANYVKGIGGVLEFPDNILKGTPFEYLSENERRKVSETIDEGMPLFWSVGKFCAIIEAYQSAGGAVDQWGKTFLQPMPDQPQPKDFRIIFSGPSLEGVELRELRDFGIVLDKVIRAYTVIALSERPGELIEIMGTPGFKEIFASDMEDVDIREWIGQPSLWKTEKRTYGDVKNELGLRGRLTKHGNIWAHKEDEDTRGRIREAVIDFIGGNGTAEEFGYWLFRIFGIAASYGAEVYTDPKTGKQVYVVEGFPAGSDDMVKVMNTGIVQLKDSASSHPVGAAGLIGKLPGMAVNFFDFAAQQVDVGGGRVEKRSLTEMMWGMGLPFARRLGDIDWKRFAPEFYRDWMLRIFYAGKEKDGLLTIWNRKAWRKEELTSWSFWEEFNKILNILVGDYLVAKGRHSKVSVGEADVNSYKKQIKEIWWNAIKSHPENAEWLYTQERGDKVVHTVESIMRRCGFWG